jgi:hypothetical protein
MRAWLAIGLVIALAAMACPSPSAAQATDDDADDAPAGDAADAPAADAPASDAPASDATAADATAADATAADAADGEAEPADGEGASGLGGTSALEPGDMEEEEEAAAPADDEEAVEEAQAAREPLPWRNSFFSWTHGVTPNSFFRDAQLSYNPLYYWSFNLAPRWYLDPATFFFVSQSLSYELTNSDGGSPYNHDVVLGDTLIELRRVAVLEGFIFIPGVRVLIPASKLSQAAQRYFGLGAGLTAVRVIPEAASLTIALIGRYQYWFAGRNTPATMGTSPGEEAPQAPPPVLNTPTPGDPLQSTIDQASGFSSPRHVVTAGVNMTVTPISGLTISGSAFWLSMEGHGLGPACTDVLTAPGGSICMGDQSATHWRHFTSLSLTIAYDVQPWLNLSIGWSNSTILAPFFDNNGAVRGPFNPDNNLFLTASIQIDALYEAVAGGEDDGLTPEQRQRRRQGLSRRITGTEGSF